MGWINIVIFLISVTFIPTTISDLVLELTTGGNYSIKLGSVPWLKSAPTYFHINGQYFASNGNSLNLNSTHVHTGKDKFGRWQETKYAYHADDIVINCNIKTYKNGELGANAFVFTQEYPNGAKRTKASSENKTIGGFPNFEILDTNNTLGYLTFASYMFGDRYKSMGVWDPSTVDFLDGLVGSGPLVIFDSEGNTVLIAPFTNVMAASNSLNKTDANIAWGIMGGIDEIPAGYSYSTIMVWSSLGINDVFNTWGNLVQLYYNKNKEYQKTDISLKYLGYWTDNGAYYYYKTEDNKNYEQTMIDVKQDIETTGIPYRYVQLDSWWYFKDSNLAVTKWEARPEIFPSGMKKLGKEIGLPLVLHNRFWSKDTPYSENYEFVNGSTLSAPVSVEFWNFLLGRAKTWGMVVYEQDWLNFNFMYLEPMKTNLTLATTWLDAMAESARIQNLTIQYCMAQSRHALQSLQYSIVTQGRVSDDYHLWPAQWKIGVTSLFGHAMGLALSKDTFWTSTDQPGNKYNKTEPHPALQVLVSVLSTGPVGPGDAIGHTDKDLLMKCCNAEGVILKPSKPATAIDDQIRESAFNTGDGIDGEIWSTYTDIGSTDYRFGIIMVANTTRAYDITPSKASLQIGTNNKFPDSVIYDEMINKTASFTDNNPFTIPPCSLDDKGYCLYYTSPVIKMGDDTIIIYGEIAKFVRISNQRIVKMIVNKDGVGMILTGAPGEHLVFGFSVNGVSNGISVGIDANTGCAFVSIYGTLKPSDPGSCQFEAMTTTITTTMKPSGESTKTPNNSNCIITNITFISICILILCLRPY